MLLKQKKALFYASSERKSGVLLPPFYTTYHPEVSDAAADKAAASGAEGINAGLRIAMNLTAILEEALQAVAVANDINALEEVRVAFMGKKAALPSC